MRRLSIIGCGKVGRSLGRLWARRGVFEIGEVLTRSTSSATAAVEFVGGGRPISTFESLRSAAVFMIGVQDGNISRSCEQLVAAGVLRAGDIVFHCSGSLHSGELNSAAEVDASIASVHPVKSFANPLKSVEAFEGTFCGIEGDPKALAVLGPAIDAIGGRILELDARDKSHYHAASVIVSNYLTAVLEFGLRTYERAGLDRNMALAVMEPLARGSLSSVFELGPVAALTGPVARGDAQIVARHLAAMEEWNPRYRNLYQGLGSITLELAREQGQLTPSAAKRLGQLLSRPE